MYVWMEENLKRERERERERDTKRIYREISKDKQNGDCKQRSDSSVASL